MKRLINLKSYITFLSRNKVYTTINMFGFSVSLMFVILIGVYAWQEYNVDAMHKKGDRIYAMGIHETDEAGTSYDREGSAWKLQGYLRSRYPEIESMCSFVKSKVTINSPLGDKLRKDIGYVDSTFYRMFDFPLLVGDRNHVLDQPDAAVISPELARMLFGNTDPIGKQVTYFDSLHVTVTGVMGDMKGSSIPKCDILVRFEKAADFNPSLLNDRMSNANGSSLFVMTRQGNDLRKKERDMDAYFKDFFWIYDIYAGKIKTAITPLKDLYFSNTYGENTERGDLKLLHILMGVGIVILLFSITNYINLTVAQASRRAREMATRRLLGSQRRDIITRLVAESLLMCATSTAIGIGLAFLCAPVASQLLDTDIAVSSIFLPGNLAIVVLLVLLVGILSGLIPAFVISRAKPIDVVRGTFATRSKMVLGKVFMTLQNVITISMIGISLTMAMQTRHLVTAPLGYDTRNLMSVDLVANDSLSLSTFANELKRLPCVEKVSFCMGTPADRGNNQTVNYPEKGAISFQALVGDKNFLDILGIKVVRDNHIASTDGVYVNSQVLQALGLKEDAQRLPVPPSGYLLDADGHSFLPIRGVLSDFRLGTVTDNTPPVLVYAKKEIKYPWSTLIKVKGDPVEAYNSVNEVFKHAFGMDIINNRVYVDQQIQDRFDHEVRMSKIVSLFAGIAIVISLLGLIAMSQYFIQQRQREIAVRKVFGSTGRQICIRLLRTFLTYVVVAFVVSIPIIWHFMGDWLSGYSYRISLSPWIFLAAGAFCFVVSLVAVFFQSRMAANENPILHIKDND